jgi:hypothetical protein
MRAMGLSVCFPLIVDYFIPFPIISCHLVDPASVNTDRSAQAAGRKHPLRMAGV